MTRLTNEMRDEIVDKIMKMVPVVDYRGKIKEALNDAARKEAPQEVMAMYGTPNWRFVSSVNVCIQGDGYFAVCPLPDCTIDKMTDGHPDPSWRAVYSHLAKAGLIGAQERQNKQRAAMRAKLMQIMKSTTTVNGLRKVLSPDLHHFVPVDVETAINLPVPAVVDELKAMGMVFGGDNA